jgi:hypothetical protein
MDCCSGSVSWQTPDLTNYRNSYRLSPSDIPHRFVATYVYELPFGKGKQFDLANPIVRALASNWRIGGVMTLQAGEPIQISGAADGSVNGRANIVPGARFEVPKELQHWYDGKTTVTLPDGRQVTPCNHCYLKYNLDAFTGKTAVAANGKTVADQYWFGNAAVDYTSLRQPGLFNWNMSLERTFAVRERLQMSLAALATNAFNRPEFKGSYQGNLGGTNIATNGTGNNTSYGSHNNTTLDPRQVELRLVVRF